MHKTNPVNSTIFNYIKPFCFQINESRVSTFLIVDTDIKDPIVYEEYKKLAKPTRTENADCTLFILDGDWLKKTVKNWGGVIF